MKTLLHKTRLNENTAVLPQNTRVLPGRLRGGYAASIKTQPGRLAGFPPSKITLRVFGKGIPVRSAA